MQQRPTVEAVHAGVGRYVPVALDVLPEHVGTGQCWFRLAEPPAAHHNVVKVRWEMITTTDETVASVGTEFVLIDTDGRINSDHQFLETLSATANRRLAHAAPVTRRPRPTSRGVTKESTDAEFSQGRSAYVGDQGDNVWEIALTPDDNAIAQPPSAGGINSC
jgi:hypothetical protein